MNKTPWFSALILAAGPAMAQGPGSPPSTLPVRQVTLFTSGVAYTERAGAVDGDAAVPLLFRTAQINDILKSMVLLDTRGKVQPATYTARDPIGHTLQSFAVDVTNNLTEGQILLRLRGERVSAETPDKPAVTGQIVGVEQQDLMGANNRPIRTSVLTLFTGTGLTSVTMGTGSTVRLLDERLNTEFQEALTLLASNTDEQRRQVMLHFAGAGRREVRVGYVTEAPLWKISYRLVLGGMGAKAGAKPYMQGWALVENTSDDDWKDVRLSLVSGRPVSFIQDLYQPLYLPRPVVGPDVVASPYPQSHEGDLQSPAAAGGPAGFRGAASGGMGGFGGGGAMGPAGAAGPARPEALDRMISVTDSAALLSQSVQAQAAGEKAGELFEYNIKTPVTLPRRQSAMIPIVAQEIDADKVSIYNADTGARYPLNAVRLHNTTNLHLKAGPVTIFDGGVYAGDARMEDIPPGDSRLLSYAVDLSVEGAKQSPDISSLDTAFSLHRRVLTVSRRVRIETTYTLKSKAAKPRLVLVEHPFDSQYRLVAPAKAAERTASLYRFAVVLAPGKSQSLKVVTERPLTETFGIVDGDMDALVGYAGRKGISARLRAALEEAVTRRRHVQELHAQAAARTTEEQSMSGDQERIRKNMMALDQSSALYKRYVSELDDQETKIENLRKEATRLRAEAEAADKALNSYVDSLGTVE